MQFKFDGKRGLLNADHVRVELIFQVQLNHVVRIGGGDEDLAGLAQRAGERRQVNPLRVDRRRRVKCLQLVEEPIAPGRGVHHAAIAQTPRLVQQIRCVRNGRRQGRCRREKL